jgi:hypothetical protein
VSIEQVNESYKYSREMEGLPMETNNIDEALVSLDELPPDGELMSQVSPDFVEINPAERLTPLSVSHFRTRVHTNSSDVGSVILSDSDNSANGDTPSHAVRLGAVGEEGSSSSSRSRSDESEEEKEDL